MRPGFFQAYPAKHSLPDKEKSHAVKTQIWSSRNIKSILLGGPGIGQEYCYSH